MYVVRQRFCTCRFNGVQPVGRDDPKDIDHLTVTTGLAFELFAHTPYSNGQFPFLKRCAVAQCARFAREDRQ